MMSPYPLDGKPRSKCRKWQLRAVDAQGNRRTKVCHGSYSAAQSATLEFERSLARDAVTPDVQSHPIAMTLDAYAQMYMSLRAPSVAPSTAAKERRHLACVTMHLGDRPLSEITPAAVERCLAALRGGQSPSGKRLSSTYLNCIYSTLSQMLDHAAEIGDIHRNPLKGIKSLRPRRPKTTKRALTRGQSAKLLASLDSSNKYHIAVALMLTMGLRRGEVAGLSWRDVDMDARVIHVEHSLDAQGDLRPPKTDAGIRTLPIPDVTYSMLDDYRASVMPALSTPLIAADDGGRIRSLSISAWWRKHRDSFGLTDWTLHELRHTYLTTLAIIGVSPAVVQSLAGHSTPDVALEIYTHVNVDAQRDAVSRYSDMLLSDVLSGDGCDPSSARASETI